MTITLSDEQQQVLKHQGHCLIVGAAGTGKSRTLLEKAAQSVQGKKKARVAVVGFSWRSIAWLKAEFADLYPALQGKVQFCTIKDLAQEALAEAGQSVRFLNNTDVRGIIRQAMKQEDFKGTEREAEHIIRSFRSQLKNPTETERYFPLFDRYRALMDDSGGMDRYTLIRKHIIGMDKGDIPLTQADVLLVDNVQDITPVQRRWLQTHAVGGLTLVLAGNDDTTIFGRDGAMGAQALRDFAAMESMTRFQLTQNFRTPPTLFPALSKVPRLLRDRVAKTETCASDHTGQLTVKPCSGRGEEIQAIIRHIQNIQTHQGRVKIGLVTRDDRQANTLAHVLTMRGIKPANWGRLVWEQPVAQTVLDALYVLLNQAQESQLFNVLRAMGVSAEVLASLVQHDFKAQHWLVEEAPLPDGLAGDVAPLWTARRQLLNIWHLVRDRHASPQDAFKVLVQELLPSFPENQREDGLLALDMLLQVDGPIVEKLSTLKEETLPDMSSPLVVTPVREARNMAFAHLILPFAEADAWPRPATPELGADLEHERRLFYMAVSRTCGSLLVTHTHKASPFVQELQTALKTFKKPKR